jgi:membrane protease YdiL (CAAX protease family)
MLTAGIMLAVCIAFLVSTLIRGNPRFARFKELTETADRQTHLRGWVIKSFLIFFGLTIVDLAVLHRLSALIRVPPEFAPLTACFQLEPGDISLLSVTLFAAGTLLAGVALGFLLRKMLRKLRERKDVVPAGIVPLLPRNRAETVYLVLLSLNAGLSEEAFFRLLLPLLIALLTHNALLGFIASGMMFGLVHLYQGRVGVIFTTLLGLAFTVFYLATGQLWVAAAIHALIDVLGFIVKPALLRRKAARIAEGAPA